jgi:hypothetical protein
MRVLLLPFNHISPPECAVFNLVAGLSSTNIHSTPHSTTATETWSRHSACSDRASQGLGGANSRGVYRIEYKGKVYSIRISVKTMYTKNNPTHDSNSL